MNIKYPRGILLLILSKNPRSIKKMAHAFKLVHPGSATPHHPDKIVTELFAHHLATIFCTDIGEMGHNAFHFLFASDLQEYFQFCEYFERRVGHKCSALSKIEVRILSSYLEKLKRQEKFGEVDERGADIYVVSARYKGKPFLSSPIIRKTRAGDISGEKGSTIETWRYTLLTDQAELNAKIGNLSSSLRAELELIRPVLFGFSLDDSGNPILVEIIPNFGLSDHSILPTALELNGIELKEFLIDVYGIK